MNRHTMQKQTKPITLCFLGASKRVSLLERFVLAANELDVPIRMLSVEASTGFVPISFLAETHAGPRFTDPGFSNFLSRLCNEQGVDLLIPNMDAATVALAHFAERGEAFCAVSSVELCEAMHDKARSDTFFREHGIPVPVDTPGRYPKIAKPVFGFGGKGIRRLASDSERTGIGAEFIIQDFVEGQETTCDFYVDRQGALLGCVLRDRIEVSDGEVMVCRTRQPSAAEKALIEKVAGIAGWYGCITLQYITDSSGKSYVIEINPRFGGGATCSIEAGLDMPKYLLMEFMGQKAEPAEKIRNIMMSRARRDFFTELNQPGF
jgi:carbamoyl-phosphate synthase large subunit